MPSSGLVAPLRLHQVVCKSVGCWLSPAVTAFCRLDALGNLVLVPHCLLRSLLPRCCGAALGWVVPLLGSVGLGLPAVALSPLPPGVPGGGVLGPVAVAGSAGAHVAALRVGASGLALGVPMARGLDVWVPVGRLVSVACAVAGRSAAAPFPDAVGGVVAGCCVASELCVGSAASAPDRGAGLLLLCASSFCYRGTCRCCSPCGLS